jgi:hypothetical protein
LTDWLPLLPASDSDGDELLILLDASGSMAGVKLESAKRAVRAVAALAGSKARARAAIFRKGLGPLVSLGGGALENWLRVVEARGSTDVLAALSGAAAAFEGDGRRRVFLVSDGLDKGGGGIAAEARKRGEELRQARVQLTAFAVGADSDREFLAALTLDGAIGQVLDVRDADSLPPALTEAFGRGSFAPGGPVLPLRPPGAPLTFAGLPPIGAVVKTRTADGAFLLAATPAGDPVFAWHRVARVAAFAGLPGSAEAPAYVNPGDLWRDVFFALAGPRLEASAVLGGGRVSVEGVPGDAAAVVLTQGGARAVAYRRDGRVLEGDAAGLRPGPAALSSLTGEALGPVFVEAPVPDEASPHATPVQARGLEGLRGSPETASPSSSLALAGLLALVAAVFLPRRPSL